MKNMSKKEYFVSKKVGMAINRYDMISEGDKVLVGVSGGKDSLTLLRVLVERKRWLPIDYEVKAIHVTTDYDEKPKVKKKVLKEYFESIGCGYVFKDIEIAEKNKRKREDCFWCSWNRRKAIFQTADKLGFKKIALGHHKDDVAETIMMNLIYNGEISGINPVQRLFNGKIIIVRPLIFLEEKEILGYAGSAGIPTIKARCPRDKDSKRAAVKDVILRLSKDNPDIKTNIIKAPNKIKEEYISEITEEESAYI